MLIAHKIALNPNATQAKYFARAAGTARFAWNWGLAEWKRQYDAGEKPSDASLRRQLNDVKREQFPWMYDVTKCAVQEAIIDLGTAFQSFFSKRGKYPRFKNRSSRRSFCAANESGTIKVDGKRIKLPVIGWVKMREAVRFSGTIKRATVSFDAGRWFVSLTIDAPDPEPVIHPVPFVGVDLGVKNLATMSDGSVVVGPKPHKAALKKLRRANKSLSRKQGNSANRRKARAKVSKIHARIKDIRKDCLHKLTTKLTKTYAVIGIEDLNVRGMVKNRCLSRAVSDMGFYEFRRQLDYKARLYGSRVVVVNRWEPTSKTCSCCGEVKTSLALSERTFECLGCGLVIDRDLNAARNIEQIAASSAVSNACGEERSGVVRKHRVKRSSVKQEPTKMVSCENYDFIRH